MPIETLDLTNAVKLERLSIVTLPVKELDLSKNANLIWIQAVGTQLQQLDVSQTKITKDGLVPGTEEDQVNVDAGVKVVYAE